MEAQHSRVLVLEDHGSTRRSLEIELKKRGFDVLAASEIAEARREIREARPFEVAVLDMRLNEVDKTAQTGADLGLEMQQELPDPPEFLIYSAHPKPEYFRKAFELQAAAYLEKPEPTFKVAQHVVGLALRRRLHFRDDDSRSRISALAKSGGRRSEVILRFCNELLMPEIQAVIDLPAMLLLGEATRFELGEETRSEFKVHPCDVEAPFSSSPEDFKILFDLPSLRINYSEPTTLRPGDLAGLGERGSPFTATCMSVLPLAKYQEFTLLLLLKPPPAEPSRAGDTEGYSRTILRYCRQQVLSHIFELGSQLALAADRQRLAVDRQRTVLSCTASIFLKIGQEILYRLQEWNRAQESSKKAHIEALETLACNLRDGGEILEDLGRDHPTASATPLSVRKLVEAVWNELTEVGDGTATLEISGEANLIGDYESTYLALTELFGWLSSQLEPGKRQVLTVDFSESEGDAIIAIWCPGKRLPRAYRQHLFEASMADAAEHLAPGSHLGLYLARVLLEVRSNGRLEDRSEEEESGYHFHLRIPNEPAETSRTA